MTEKELKKLSRVELLEMLVAQSKEVEKLEEQLKRANETLEDRRIMINKAGSIAEASLQLNGIFQAAQNAASQYMENIKRQEELCTGMLSDAKQKCRIMENETREKCDSMVKSAELRAQKYWDDVSEKVAQLAEAQAGLKELFAEPGLRKKQVNP